MTDNNDKKLEIEKILAYITFFVILLIPTVGITTIELRFNHYELTFFWPWLILQQIVPSGEFGTFQYNFIKIPWSLFIFIPFAYVAKNAYDILTKEETDRILSSFYIVLASIVQIVFIGVTYSSNFGYRNAGLEQNRIYYIPQFILILLHGFYSAKWLFEDVNKSLKESKAKRKEEENPISNP